MLWGWCWIVRPERILCIYIYIYKELNANAVCPYLIFTFPVSGCFANCKGKRTRFREHRSKLNLLLETGFCKPCFEQHRSKGVRTLSLKATGNFQWTKRWRNQEKTLTSAEGSQTFDVLLAHATLALLLKSFFFKLVGLALPCLKKKKTQIPDNYNLPEKRKKKKKERQLHAHSSSVVLYLFFPDCIPWHCVVYLTFPSLERGQNPLHNI